MIETAAPTTSAEKDKAIQTAVSSIEKSHGKGSVFSLGDRVGVKVPCIPTGIWSVDQDVLGIGGLARGRIIEIYGPESSGKTTLALGVVAAAQRAGGRAAIVDVEHALDPTWMSLNRVDVQSLLVSQPDCGEQALEITEALIQSKAIDVAVVDSVAALVPKAEILGDFGDSHMGLQARLMSQAMRKLNGLVSSTGCVLIFINQIRQNIGVTFGNPETTTGGRALKFYASVRLDVRRIGAVKDGEAIIGSRVKIKASKNKLSAPFREAEVDLLYDRGFDGAGSLVDAAVEAGFIERSGSWFSYHGERLGQGRLNAIQFMRENNMLEALEKELRVE